MKSSHFEVKLRLLLMNELGVVLIKYFVDFIFDDERFKTSSIADPWSELVHFGRSSNKVATTTSNLLCPILFVLWCAFYCWRERERERESELHRLAVISPFPFPLLQQSLVDFDVNHAASTSTSTTEDYDDDGDVDDHDDNDHDGSNDNDDNNGNVIDGHSLLPATLWSINVDHRIVGAAVELKYRLEVFLSSCFSFDLLVAKREALKLQLLWCCFVIKKKLIAVNLST